MYCSARELTPLRFLRDWLAKVDPASVTEGRCSTTLSILYGTPALELASNLRIINVAHVPRRASSRVSDLLSTLHCALSSMTGNKTVFIRRDSRFELRLGTGSLE